MKQIILQAIAFINAIVTNNKALRDAIAERDAKLAEQAETLRQQAEALVNVHAQVSVNAVDVEAMKQTVTDAKAAQTAAQEAATAATSHTAELQAQLDEINGLSEQLRTAINDNKQTPNVDDNFAIEGETNEAPAEEAPEQAAEEPAADTDVEQASDK